MVKTKIALPNVFWDFPNYSNNSPVMAGRDPRKYLNRSPYILCSKSTSNGNGSVYCFRSLIFTLIFLSFFS